MHQLYGEMLIVAQWLEFWCASLVNHNQFMACIILSHDPASNKYPIKMPQV